MILIIKDHLRVFGLVWFFVSRIISLYLYTHFYRFTYNRYDIHIRNPPLTTFVPSSMYKTLSCLVCTEGEFKYLKFRLSKVTWLLA